ncbi:hypothetical protein E4T47_03389 [Aureobasidium subglaciale]|nr:hypothetical protein E4T43_04980 [Aureobasidium subglaciale]KAI5273488.1 hypothetical protein E4T47_03389 [Aureobasidium subglaciale]
MLLNQSSLNATKTIDLSTFTGSDGDSNFFPKHLAREDNISFLARLSDAFNASPRLVLAVGGRVEFINQPPLGYASFLRPEVYGDGQRVDRFVYGHPSGMSFASLMAFAEHVVMIMKKEVKDCACVNCQGAPIPAPRFSTGFHELE